MVRLRPFIILMMYFVLFAKSFAWNNLYIRDPRGWQGGQGTIEEATLSIRPEGSYMEVGIYLTFSDRNLLFDTGDSLEIELNFDLPEKAIVHDSWLWVEDDIIRGEIMDRWTASSIYEDIVKRRRDPSILLKEYETQYSLKIFPLFPGGTRKAKISYLVPVGWTSRQISIPLPVNLFKQSRYAIPKINLLAFLDENWKNPQILELSDQTFQQEYDPSFGDYYKANLSWNSLTTQLNFGLDAPWINGLYVDYFMTEGSGYYQMILLPSEVLDLQDSNKKLSILIDYDTGKTDISKSDVLSDLKNVLINSFTEKDSFNLHFSNLPIKRASEQWIAGDSIAIETTFQSILESNISNYSNLPTLLSDGIEFIQQHGNNGSLLLLACSDQVSHFQSANNLVDDLLALMDPILPIHIIDFTNWNVQYQWIGNNYYYGNDYFYTNLSRLTSGDFRSLKNSGNDFFQLLKTGFESLGGFIQSFDIHTKLENGFCFGRFNQIANMNTVYLNHPFVQIGQFNGTFPFEIEMAGIFNDQVFSKSITLQPQELTESDSLLRTIWTGLYIHDLEQENQSNDMINEILYHSLKERVLSLHSAFLCLEPSMGAEICYGCMDESELVGVDDRQDTADSDSVSVTAFPNPFNQTTCIKFKMPKRELIDQTQCRVYNVMGQLVRTFEVSQYSPNEWVEINWNGQNDNGLEVATGQYFFTLVTPEKRVVFKLLFMK